MAADTGDRHVTRGYSLPVSVHERIQHEAKEHGFSNSALVHQALRLWFAVEGSGKTPKLTRKPAKKSA